MIDRHEMDLAALTIPAARLSRPEQTWDGPLAIIDHADQDIEPDDLRLPPCPVIGLGIDVSPLTRTVDVLLDEQRSLKPLASNILRSPSAAAVCVQVLRATAVLDPAHALTLESMAYGMLQGSAEHRAWRSGRAAAAQSEAAGRVVTSRRGESLDLTLDRPWAGNAIDRTMRDDLASALALAGVDASLRHVRLRAKGKAFSLGADLAEFGTTLDPATAHAIRALTLPAHAAIACADKMEVWVDGACIGAGLELAAFARRVVATPRSWFQLPELAMGIIPGAGGCVSVPRRIGRQRAALMMLSGRRIGARQALSWGLIDAIVDHFPADDGDGDIG